MLLSPCWLQHVLSARSGPSQHAGGGKHGQKGKSKGGKDTFKGNSLWQNNHGGQKDGSKGKGKKRGHEQISGGASAQGEAKK